MAYKTAQQLMLDTLKAVGLVSGTAVQTYTEPMVYASIQTMFDMVFKKRFWDHLTDWHTVVLNGVTGLATTDLDTFLDDHTDVQSVWLSDFSRQIVLPYQPDYKIVNGSDALYYTPIKYDPGDPSTFTKKVLQFWPLTATSSVAIRCRSRPADFIPQDIVPFPAHVLAQASAWNLLESDGINPTAASKAQQLFDILYQDLIAAEGEGDIGFGGGRTNVPLTIRTL